jgi:hypothetical protein
MNESFKNSNPKEEICIFRGDSNKFSKVVVSVSVEHAVPSSG